MFYPKPWALWLHDNCMDWLVGVGDIRWTNVIRDGEPYSREYTWAAVKVGQDFTLTIGDHTVRGIEGDVICAKMIGTGNGYVTDAVVVDGLAWPSDEWSTHGVDGLSVLRA